MCNLITGKLITLDLGFHVFTLPAGILPYPFTFLVTDILSEIYGRKKANLAVGAGFVAMLFTMIIIYLGLEADAIPESKVSNEAYETVFGSSMRAILASMVAYLFAQFVDVRLFHFWKKLTNGKHLWLRNNASTILSQLLDSTLVILVLYGGDVELSTLKNWILEGWFFKVIFALLDTPIIYLIVFGLRRYFMLKPNEELAI